MLKFFPKVEYEYNENKVVEIAKNYYANIWRWENTKGIKIIPIFLVLMFILSLVNRGEGPYYFSLFYVIPGIIVSVQAIRYNNKKNKKFFKDRKNVLRSLYLCDIGLVIFFLEMGIMIIHEKFFKIGVKEFIIIYVGEIILFMIMSYILSRNIHNKFMKKFEYSNKQIDNNIIKVFMIVGIMLVKSTKLYNIKYIFILGVVIFLINRIIFSIYVELQYEQICEIMKKYQLVFKE